MRAFPGEWMVTATSKYPWNGVFGGPFATLPLGSYQPLWISSAMHSLVSSSSYLTILGAS